jgi:hypothetical protein
MIRDPKSLSLEQATADNQGPAFPDDVPASSVGLPAFPEEGPTLTVAGKERAGTAGMSGGDIISGGGRPLGPTSPGMRTGAVTGRSGRAVKIPDSLRPSQIRSPTQARTTRTRKRFRRIFADRFKELSAPFRE